MKMAMNRSMLIVALLVGLGSCGGKQSGGSRPSAEGGPAEAVAPDVDKDGIADLDDECPAVAVDADSFEDVHGRA